MSHHALVRSLVAALRETREHLASSEEALELAVCSHARSRAQTAEEKREAERRAYQEQQERDYRTAMMERAIGEADRARARGDERGAHQLMESARFWR